MLTFYAGNFVLILDNLALFCEILSFDPGRFLNDRPSLSRLMKSVEAVLVSLEAAELISSATQARRVLSLWQAVEEGLDPRNLATFNPRSVPTVKDLIDNVKELERRIRDDLHQRMFYCISANKANLLQRDPAEHGSVLPGLLRLKSASEYFGADILRRFPPIERDLELACQCAVFECNPACVFHLMRATEIAVPKLAKLCGIDDPKPSWGSLLDKAEKFTQRTRYDELPDTLKPHIGFLGTVVADMRGMQRAWRNKVVHVEDKLIIGPGDFPPQVAAEILTSTRAFLHDLAVGLPDWC